jgi:arylsulfatase A
MKKPNIILINCDDLGYGDLGCYGSKKNDTPYLDNLAKEGMKFNDFYMASPVCSPSRGGMLTGCYPPRISFGTFNGEWVLFPGHDVGLNPNETTIAKILKNAGYATMCIGKWHCGDQPEFLPTRHGFDDYYGLPYSNDMAPMKSRPSSPPLPLIRGEEVIQEQPDQRSLTERYVEKAIEFIKKYKNNPFFLYFAHMHVHLPLYAADVFVKASRNGDYGACVAAIDWATGAVIHALKKYDLYENTIIIFTSDNGSRNDFGDSNGPLRGTKATTWEGGQRVPLIVHWKGHINPGVSDEIVSSIDLYPSLAKIAGGKIPNDRIIDGMDVSDLLLGKTNKSPRNTFFYYMCNNLEAVRVGDWKLHISRRPGAGKPGVVSNSLFNNEEVKELYNLREDIGESNNLYNGHPDIVAKLMEKIDYCREDIGDTFTNTKPKNVREIGRVKNARPLTSYDENHPYIIAMYDRDEIG